MLSSALCLLATIHPLLGTAIPTKDHPVHPEHPQHPEHPHGAPNATILGPQPLNITTLTGNAQNESVFECWQVADLTVSDTPGIQGALFTNLGTPRTFNYVNIPPKFDGGLHNAPAVQ